MRSRARKKADAAGAFTMSVLAVLVAVTTVLGHRTHTEAVLNQNKATDQWNDYQAKKIRSNDTQLAADLLSVMTVRTKTRLQKDRQGICRPQAKWADRPEEKKQDEAEALEAKVEQARRKRRPLRSGRGAAGDRAGDHLGHAADTQPRSTGTWALYFLRWAIASAVSVSLLK